MGGLGEGQEEAGQGYLGSERAQEDEKGLGYEEQSRLTAEFGSHG